MATTTPRPLRTVRPAAEFREPPPQKPPSTRTTRRRSEEPPLSTIELRRNLTLVLGGLNSIAVGLNPQFAKDALHPEEIELLAQALADEVNAVPTLRRAVRRMMNKKASAHIQLAMVLMIIATPRLVRRGMVPDGSEKLAAAVAMAAGGASDGDRGNQQRQEHAGGGGASTSETVPDRDPYQDGPLPEAGGIPGTNGHIESNDDFGSPFQPDRAAPADDEERAGETNLHALSGS